MTKFLTLPLSLLLVLGIAGFCTGLISLEPDWSLNRVPAVEYDYEDVIFDRSTSLWLLKSDSSRLSGFVVRHYPKGGLAEKLRIREGRKEGFQLNYFADGRLRYQETYRANRLHGEVKRWSLENGYGLLAQLNYKEGKLNGIQRKWYSTGELHKLLNLKNGGEEGMQKAFRKNGALYANYEARGGKVYGLNRANLCYELDYEKVVYKQ